MSSMSRHADSMKNTSRRSCPPFVSKFLPASLLMLQAFISQMCHFLGGFSRAAISSVMGIRNVGHEVNLLGVLE